MLYLVLFSFVLTGCGVLSHHMQNQQDWLNAIEDARNSYEKEYVGKSKNHLLVNLGEPRSIDPDAWIHGEQYEESWYYNFSKGVYKEFHSEPAKAVWFYIQDGVVQAVNVF